MTSRYNFYAFDQRQLFLCLWPIAFNLKSDERFTYTLCRQ